MRGIVCRELISNMLIHREFTSPYPAKLEIDRAGLHTQNASRTFFEGSITLNDFSPMPKNPSIANVFTQIGLAEELGSGTRERHAQPLQVCAKLHGWGSDPRGRSRFPRDSS